MPLQVFCVCNATNSGIFNFPKILKWKNQRRAFEIVIFRHFSNKEIHEKSRNFRNRDFATFPLSHFPRVFSPGAPLGGGRENTFRQSCRFCIYCIEPPSTLLELLGCALRVITRPFPSVLTSLGLIPLWSRFLCVTFSRDYASCLSGSPAPARYFSTRLRFICI